MSSRVIKRLILETLDGDLTAAQELRRLASRRGLLDQRDVQDALASTVRWNHFEVLVSRWDDFEKKFGQLAKKAVRVGIDAPLEYRIHGDDERPVYSQRLSFDANGKVVSERVLTGYRPIKLVSVSIPEVKLEGDWGFIGSVEHNYGNPDEPNMLYPRVGDADFEQYRSRANTCDHCDANRRRKKTFVLRNAITGVVKRVGSTCVAEFLGIDVKGLLSMMGFGLSTAGWPSAHLRSDAADTSLRPPLTTVISTMATLPPLEPALTSTVTLDTLRRLSGSWGASSAFKT